jgi:hypothetical protein
MTEPIEVETNPEIVSVEHPEPEVIGSDVEQPEAEDTAGRDSLHEAIAEKAEDAKAAGESESGAEPEGSPG